MGAFDFIDCGAHLGLFSAQFVAHSYGVRQLTLIEPNRELFPLMESNIRGARAEQVRCVNAALSDFEGRGRLVMPEYGTDADALFLVPDPAGDVDVITLSSVLRSRTHSNAAIKVDAEGQEGPILRGAKDAIRALAKVALIVEVHKKVLDRIGVSDVSMMEEIDAIRPLRWVNAQDGAPVNPHRSIFGQLGAGAWDLIGVSE
ncbi:MAG: FkbM family methyltransferase [Acetobacteraceae bacterium]